MTEFICAYGVIGLFISLAILIAVARLACRRLARWAARDWTEELTSERINRHGDW